MNSKLNFLKTVGIITLCTTSFLILWLAIVYLGNVYFADQFSANQYLLWIMCGIICYIANPFIAYLSTVKKTFEHSHRITKMQNSDWLFLVMVTLITGSILFWIFGNIEHHKKIYDFFVDIFGKNRKGNPNFPIIIIPTIMIFFLFGIFEILYNKIRYGVYQFPTFREASKHENYFNKRSIYYGFVLSSTVLSAVLYFLKIIAFMD